MQTQGMGAQPPPFRHQSTLSAPTGAPFSGPFSGPFWASGVGPFFLACQIEKSRKGSSFPPMSLLRGPWIFPWNIPDLPQIRLTFVAGWLNYVKKGGVCPNTICNNRELLKKIIYLTKIINNKFSYEPYWIWCVYCSCPLQDGISRLNLAAVGKLRVNMWGVGSGQRAEGRGEAWGTGARG